MLPHGLSRCVEGLASKERGFSFGNHLRLQTRRATENRNNASAFFSESESVGVFGCDGTLGHLRLFPGYHGHATNLSLQSGNLDRLCGNEPWNRSNLRNTPAGHSCAILLGEASSNLIQREFRGLLWAKIEKMRKAEQVESGCGLRNRACGGFSGKSLAQKWNKPD
ncbi:uncharacterized protein BJX67DRAFT_290825 [Aspergillus lucknowensis]|uniref:Uncharacterized protein n=1 Tax=Aspergillus lucknowensis TaxID=176173 RepID=A0ABR4LDX7_9EURO